MFITNSCVADGNGRIGYEQDLGSTLEIGPCQV